MYGVVLLTGKAWTIEPRSYLVVKGLVWHTDGSEMQERTGAGVLWHSFGRRLNTSLWRHTTVFQPEIHESLACVYEIQKTSRSEKCISICSGFQAAPKALQAVRTTSPLVWLPPTIRWDSYGSPDILVLSESECQSVSSFGGFPEWLKMPLDRLLALCKVRLMAGLPPSCF
jgi:hypothetical protein